MAQTETSLQRGIEHYRAGRFAEAVDDLNATTQALLSGPEMQAYVDTGKFGKITEFETALVYLALAHSKLGNEAAAREAVQRLMTAERIEPMFARLTLGNDAEEFSTIASQLVPDANLGQPVQVATSRAQLVERMVNEECARIQREADEKIAAIQQAADERVARAEAAQRAAEQQLAAMRRPDPQPEIRIETKPPADWLEALNRADELLTAVRHAEANEIYARVAGSSASRALRIRAAVGLYRTGAYRRAVDALHGISPFARGEEDLRYYYAVSLYETGRYTEARVELICALPFIRQTEDVIRYRTKIEQMIAWQNAEPVRSASE